MRAIALIGIATAAALLVMPGVGALSATAAVPTGNECPEPGALVDVCSPCDGIFQVWVLGTKVVQIGDFCF